MKPNPLRIGNQTSFAAALYLEPFEFAVKHGFNAFEFFPDRGFTGAGGWDEREVDASTRRLIRQTAAGHDVTLTVHAPLEFDPLRDGDTNRLYSTVEFAADIGAALVNLHLDARQGAAGFVDALGPALLATAQAGVQLTLENTVFTGPDDFNRFFAALHGATRLPIAHVGMCFDLGHANLHSATLNDYLAFVDRLSAQVPVRHLHLHEDHGDRDSHLTLFTGPAGQNPAGIAGLLSRLAGRGYSGCAILEQWPQPPSLLVDARNQLLKLIESA
jgi:sugar phosphate isomerase/epimerase